MAIQEILFYASLVCFALAVLSLGLAAYWFFSRHIRDVLDDLNGKKLAADIEREARGIGRANRNRHEPSATVKAAVMATAPEEKWRTGGSKSNDWSDSSAPTGPPAAGGGSARGTDAGEAKEPAGRDVSKAEGPSPSARQVPVSAAADGAFSKSEGQPAESGSPAPEDDGHYDTDILAGDMNRPATEILSYSVEHSGGEGSSDEASPSVGAEQIPFEVFQVTRKIVLTSSEEYITAI